MSFKLNKLKQIKNDDKLIVFGYVKQLQKKLSLQNIPQVITYICLAYYHLEIDYFEKCRGLNIKISHDQHNAAKIGSGHTVYHYDIAFCKLWIRTWIQQIMTWKLRIDRLRSSIIIRFVPSESELTGSYGIRSNGDTFTLGSCTRVNAPKSFHSGDISTLIMNTINRTISMKTNDSDTQTIFEKIAIGNDIKYKLCVTFPNAGSAVTIVE